MGCRSRLSIAIAALATAATSVACRPSSETGTDAGAIAAPSASAPVDRLAADELVEGKQNAFGLTLPLLMPVQSDIENEMTAVGNVPMDSVVKFVQARVGAGTANLGKTLSVFNDVRVPSAPNRPLHIEITARGTTTRMTVRDDAVPMVPISPAEALKRNGVGPDNKILDPQHMQ